MGHQYTGADTYPTDFTVPDDLDDDDASTFDVAFEALGDRTEHLHLRTSPLADIAALTAITTPTDGLVRHVLGKGYYVFKTAVTTGSAPFWFAADDATPGGWVSSTARRIGLVGMQDATLANTVGQAATPYTDVPGLSLTVACEAGDLLAIDASILTSCLGVHAVRIMIDDGGVVDPAQSVHYASTVDDAAALSWRDAVRSFHYVAANTGNVTIRVQAKYTGGGGVTVVNIGGLNATDGAASTLRVQQFRG